MKKGAIIISLVALGALCAVSQQRFYVEAHGTASGDGSARRPFGTLTQARDAIRTARRTGSLKSHEQVTVLVGPGNYRLKEGLTLNAEDSGTPAAPVIWRARKRGQTRLQGGLSIPPSAFKPVTEAQTLTRLDAQAREHVLVCDLAEHLPSEVADLKTAFRGPPEAPWLYVNQAPQTLARWPNLGDAAGEWAEFSQVVDTGLPQPEAANVALHTKRPGAFVFEDPRPTRWNLAQGVWLLGYWTHDWYDEVIRVADYAADKGVIKMAAPHGYGIMGGTWGAAKRRFFAINLLEELDVPGEWWMDRQRKLLYLYPPDNFKRADIALATLTTPLLTCHKTKYVHFVDLIFEYGHASDALILRDTEQVQVLGCTVANHAGTGITVSGRQNTVLACDLYNLGKVGIQLNGGDRAQLISAHNRAENNYIHHYGLFQRTYAPGIGVQGCGQIVRHNCIHDAPHNAILYGGNEHLFEFNEIYRVVMETGDAGAFYSGRDWTSQGNILRHNFIHNLGGGDSKHINTMGVYLDDCDCGDTLEGNIFWRAGRAIMIGGGRDNPVLNNLVIDCPIGLHIDARGMTWKQWNSPITSDASWALEAKAQALKYQQPPWSTRYPNLARIMEDAPREPLHNPIRNNIFVDCTKQVYNFDGNVMKLLDKLEIQDNLAVNTSGSTNNLAPPATVKGFSNISGSGAAPLDLGFNAPAQGNFTLKARARLFRELPTFKPLPVEKIGLYQDAYRRRLPRRDLKYPELAP